MTGRADVPLPDHLRLLADQLAEVSTDDQQLVIAAARNARPRRLKTIPWSELEKLKGIVSLGGNAVDDCNALYEDP
jgi:hypothetical protein